MGIVRYCVRILRYRTLIMMLRLAVLAAIGVVVLSGPSGYPEHHCKDMAKLSMCKWTKEKGNCRSRWSIKNCAKTCGTYGYCPDDEDSPTGCHDMMSSAYCDPRKMMGWCYKRLQGDWPKSWMKERCAKTCRFCRDD